MFMLDRFERAVERLVDGSVAGVFRLRVQPAEIGRRLERAMIDGRVASVGAMLAPNLFEARLHPDDAAEFADWEDALCREMESWLAEVAFARGLTLVGAIRVRIVADQGVRRRSVRAAARFESRVVDLTVERSGPRPVRLEPIDNDFSTLSLSGTVPRTVGRDRDNDLVLPHPEVSRRHARIELDWQRWRVVDLNSTNGTWINGERIETAVVSVGDEVAFAGLRFAVGPE
jgi:hypothetical protein